MDWHAPGLRSVPGYPEMRHTPVLVEGSDGEAHDFIALEAVVEEHGEECPIAPGQEPGALRRI